ncbi:MAG: glycine cleavage system aminomethyltransferase GcvT [Methylococcales bacterium]|jgi:aminomethyltransferase|nr:glycine cleavage system aminomethyltransferase GcvT [Methylococcales bacterium]MBT7409119.1 glycine cleavage system aminomethyltransferase GcvT [Methylococcales bacterium]
MGAKTPLFQMHCDHHARMVDFGGWDMPLHYGSQIEEHHAVRQHAGVFDVSHMTIVDLTGEDVIAFLKKLFANNIDNVKQPGKAMYSCMLNEQGGVVDDLIVYYQNDHWCRVIVNAATRDKDIKWIARQASDFEVSIDERKDLSMLAVQGPEASEKLLSIFPENCRDDISQLKAFNSICSDEFFYARTGYTGEDGFEIIMPNSDVVTFWQKLLDAGVVPCGLGARDTLRLEAGMHLYGSDMDETVTPLESGLGWTVSLKDLDRNFNGRQVLENQKKAGIKTKWVGLVMQTRGVLRDHQEIFEGEEKKGEITSGGFSPTLGYSIALARVDKSLQNTCSVMIRGKSVECSIVKPCFVRNGQSCL